MTVAPAATVAALKAAAETVDPDVVVLLEVVTSFVVALSPAEGGPVVPVRVISVDATTPGVIALVVVSLVVSSSIVSVIAIDALFTVVVSLSGVSIFVTGPAERNPGVLAAVVVSLVALSSSVVVAPVVIASVVDCCACIALDVVGSVVASVAGASGDSSVVVVPVVVAPVVTRPIIVTPANCAAVVAL